MICRASAFFRHSRIVAPAAAFDTASCLRSPASAVHPKTNFAASQNVAPATKLQNAAAQNAAPARRKRHGSIDTLEHCACHANANRNRNLHACPNAPKTI